MEVVVKFRNFILILLAALLLFNASCQKQQDIPSDSVITEQPEPQRMAYHFGEVSRLGEDVYFTTNSSFNDSQVFATEYGSENFDVFIPCFDAVCDHWNYPQCCIATYFRQLDKLQICAFTYNGENSLLMFNPVDICLSLPYSNVKQTLLCEDFVPLLKTDFLASIDAYDEWSRSESKVRRTDPLIYRDYLYYVELKSGTRTQYRIPIAGGEPERVFEEDNIVIITILNDRFYGVKYDGDMGNNINTNRDRDKIHYFRSDMNYKNIETLPEMLDLFELSNTERLSPTSNVLLDADADFIYVLHDMKVWKIPDSDINAEPILMSDMGEHVPSDLPVSIERSWYNDGIIYTVIDTDQYNRDLLNDKGEPAKPTQWYKSSTLYSFDIRTGECSVTDMSNETYLVTEIFYADSEYLYAKCSYAHHDNRGIQGLTIRLTLDTMRYEVILPEIFNRTIKDILSE